LGLKHAPDEQSLGVRIEKMRIVQIDQVGCSKFPKGPGVDIEQPRAVRHAGDQPPIPIIQVGCPRDGHRAQRGPDDVGIDLPERVRELVDDTPREP
jgi:hypothetical protein